MQGPKSDFNGPSRDLGAGRDALDERSYCVNCGTIFVRAQPKRECPSCTNAAAIQELEERIDELENLLSDHLDEIETKLASIDSTTSLLAELAEQNRGDA